MGIRDYAAMSAIWILMLGFAAAVGWVLLVYAPFAVWNDTLKLRPAVRLTLTVVFVLLAITATLWLGDFDTQPPCPPFAWWGC